MTVISAWWRLNIRFQRSWGRSSGRWTIILLSQDSWVPDSWSRNVVGKATSGRRGLWALMNWGLEKMLRRYSKESQHAAEWALGLRLSSPGERERHNVDGLNFGVKIFQLYSVSSSLSHANLEQPFRTLAIKWEVYIFIKKSSCVCLYPASLSLRASVIHRVSMYPAWTCIWEYNTYRLILFNTFRSFAHNQMVLNIAMF